MREMAYSGRKMPKRLPTVPEPEYGDQRMPKRQTPLGTDGKRFGEAQHRGTPIPQRNSLAKWPLIRRRRASDRTLQKRKLDPKANHGPVVRGRKMRQMQ